MTPKQALETLEGVEHHGSLGEAGDVLLAVIRRDWAVRVLDAWALLEEGRNAAPILLEGQWGVRFRTPTGHGCDDIEDFVVTTDTPDTARLAAAQAVFPELPDAVRADLGGCP